jgi:transketolase
MAAPGTDTLADRDLALKSWRYRRQMLKIIKRAGAGHTGGGLSCIDILNVLYNRVLNVSPETFGDAQRDHYVQSKGHCVEALYVVLADRGFFPVSALDDLCQYGSHFVGHPTRKIPGVEQNTGALGHGLSFCVGLAIAAKLDRGNNRIYTLLGDGELAEGSNWEAAMSAAHYRLDNLTAIVDRNRLQISGRTSDVCSSEPLDSKFAAFGWHVVPVDGHNLNALTQVLLAQSTPGMPRAIIADTVKGQGVSFMADIPKWHHGVPSDTEYAQAVEEIDSAIQRLSGTSP